MAYINKPCQPTARAIHVSAADLLAAGTKADLPNRRVQEREGREWANARGFTFFEASAALGQNVKGVLASLFARILATVPGIPQDLASIAVQVPTSVRCEIQEWLQICVFVSMVSPEWMQLRTVLDSCQNDSAS